MSPFKEFTLQRYPEDDNPKISEADRKRIAELQQELVETEKRLEKESDYWTILANSDPHGEEIRLVRDDIAHLDDKAKQLKEEIEALKTGKT